MSQFVQSSSQPGDWEELGYVILGQLGRGGMGTVYLARQTAADRLVALKVLQHGLDSASGISRFRREVETLARLQHPHIVPVFEVGQYHGRPFYSMEYCSGGSLVGCDDTRSGSPVGGGSRGNPVQAASHAASGGDARTGGNARASSVVAGSAPRRGSDDAQTISAVAGGSGSSTWTGGARSMTGSDARGKAMVEGNGVAGGGCPTVSTEVGCPSLHPLYMP